MKFIRSMLAGIIFVYQQTLSPDHGPLKHFFPAGYCKYHPTCSEYSKQALLKHGVVKGLGFGVWRIIRCNPWSKGGEDLVP